MFPFRRAGESHSLAIAMTGVALGDRLLHVGCTDASLLAAISGKVGISGQASGLMPDDDDAARARRGAAQAGVLLEIDIGPTDRFPFADASFNLIVLDNQGGLLSTQTAEKRQAVMREALRTLAPRGRIVIVEAGTPAGVRALFARQPRAEGDNGYRSAGGAAALLQSQGFRAVRHLADRDGLSFFEAVR